MSGCGSDIGRDSVANGQFQGGVTGTKVLGGLVTRFAMRGESQLEIVQHGESTAYLVRNSDGSVTPSLVEVSGSSLERRVQAGLGNIDVNYDGRYSANIALRREGVSLYNSRKVWTSFTRGSVAWLLNEENWLPFRGLGLLKVRYSVGSAQTPDIQAALFSSPSNEHTPKAALNTALERELGVDFAVSDRLQASLAHAVTRSSDAQVSSLTNAQGNNFLYKMGLTGRTTEFTVQTRVFHDFHGLRWDVSVVGDHSQRVISSLDAPCSAQNGTRRLCSGESLTSIYGNRLVRDMALLPSRVATGAPAFDVNDEGYVVPVGAGNSWRDGKAKSLWGTFVTVNGVRYPWGLPILQQDSGTLSNTASIIADGNPGLLYGVQNTFRYKGFRLYGQLNGQLGGQTYNAGKQELYYSGDHPDVNQSAKPDELRKPVAYYQAVSRGRNTYLSNFVERATYARLAEASFGYVVDADRVGFLRHAGAKSVAVDLVARNLFTVTGYSGQNPQAPSFGSPIDQITYPLSRTFTLATSIVF